ncbi:MULTISPECIES: S8 family serine peptidase [unclassified Streptomyces]|uniref:S8 family serine peptidase n=1 Tax=unclassified Streptomyces TaxID=2593676 RepID=UPI0036ED7DC7
MNRLGRRTALSSSCLLLFSLASLAGLPLHTAAAAEDERGYVVVLKDSVADPKAAASRQTRAYGGSGATVVYRHALKGYAATMTPAQATALEKDPQVRFVAAQRTYKLSPPPQPVPPPPLPAPPMPDCQEVLDDVPPIRQCQPVFVDRVRADRSSARSGNGKGSVDVNVAVLDSGIAADVPDLNVQGGVDCLSGSPVFPGTSLQDPSGHGTMVAGIIGGRDDDQGLVGVAPGTPQWAVKVADDDQGLITDAALLCGIDWVASTRTDADPDNDIALFNMSFASDELPPAERDDGQCGVVNQDPAHLAICNTVTAGVTPVAAAGNIHADVASINPAAYDEVITTTAMDDFDGRPGAKVAPICYGRDLGVFGDADDAPAPFSDFARSAADRKHTVAAPGVCVESNFPLPAHHALGDGTSFAAPVVSGVLALCIDTGRCGDSSPARNLRKLVNDARKYNDHDRRYGFFGDPHRPIPGRYFGPLIAADRY